MFKIFQNSFVRNFCSQRQLKVRIANVNFNATEQEIQDYFNNFSQVKQVKLIRNLSGNSKGFGYVTLADEQSFQTALQQDKQDFMGRPMMINEALSKEEYQNQINEKLSTDPDFRSQYEQRNMKRQNDKKRQVFLRNVNFNATEQDIKDFLQDCGEIERVYLPQSSNLSRGFCYVHFVEAESAERAIEKSGSLLLGRNVGIAEVRDKRESE